MTTLTSLARAYALETERAVPIATFRHIHLGDRPLVFVPLALAGEANAPLACMVGSVESAPTLLVVAQPRNRDQRFAFAAALGRVVIDYIDGFTSAMELVRDSSCFVDAPQLVVANPAAVGFVRLLGRSTRLRRTDGEHAVDPAVPILGKWLTYFAEQAEHTGSSAIIALTATLTEHWATGQSALEDSNLAAVIGWIRPWDGLSGPVAAAMAEDPLRWPPAGPVTDPTFDNEVLAPLVRSYDHAVDDAGRARAFVALESALRGQLEPTWRLMWEGIAVLRGLPPATSLGRRWLRDRLEFTGRVEYWRDGGMPQARLDQAVAAARRLSRLEREQEAFLADRALDDVLAMAELRLAGDAFAGEVTWRDAARVDSSGPRRKLRPRVVITTFDPVRLEIGTVVRSAARPSQEARIVDVSWSGASTDVTLELTGGMGRSLKPVPGSVPEESEHVCYSTLGKDSARPAAFPDAQDTPWTHGGPPRAFIPMDEDAVEAWA